MGVGVQRREDGGKKKIITDFPEKYAGCESIEYEEVIYINKKIDFPPTCCAPGEVCAIPEFPPR